MIPKKEGKERLRQVGAKPKHEQLPWPGLTAKDHLTRVATRAVKEAREARENENWAESQIARVLDYVLPETAVKLIFREAHRRGIPIPRFTRALLRLLPETNSKPNAPIH